MTPPASHTHSAATAREREGLGDHRLRELHRSLRQRLRPLRPLPLHLPLPPDLVELEAGEARELRLAVLSYKSWMRCQLQYRC